MNHPLVNRVDAFGTRVADDIAGIDRHRGIATVGEPKTKPRLQEPRGWRDLFAVFFQRGKDFFRSVRCRQRVIAEQHFANLD